MSVIPLFDSRLSIMSSVASPSRPEKKMIVMLECGHFTNQNARRVPDENKLIFLKVSEEQSITVMYIQGYK